MRCLIFKVATSFGSSAFYLYVESILSLILGYVFWIIVSSQLGSASTGESSSAITLATLVSTIATIGMPTGIQRFLGMAQAKNDSPTFDSIARFLIIFTVGVMAASSIILLIVNHFTGLLNFSDLMFVIIILASISYSLVLSLRSIIISSRNTRILIAIAIVGNVVRFASIAPVVIFKMGSEAIAFSYLTTYVVVCLLSAYYLRGTLIFNRISQIDKMISRKKEILVASISAWAPSAISVIGTQSGILIVFGLKGSSEAGIYFIAFSIFSALSALPMSVLSMAFPVMSGMTSGRKELLWKAFKMVLFLTMPIAAAVTVYPTLVLSLFGREFGSGSYILTILMLSLIMVEVNRAVNYLAYSDGRYRQVTYLGVLPSLIRLVAYGFLAPAYGGIGAAYAFLAGSLVGFVAGILVDKKNKYELPYGSVGSFTIFPLIVGLVLIAFRLPDAIGFSLIILISYGIFARTKMVRYTDLEETINSVFAKPNVFSKNVLIVARSIFR